MTDNWIKCTDRLPEQHDSFFAKFKGTLKWNNAMYEKDSETVLVTVKKETMKPFVTTGYLIDGAWRLSTKLSNLKVIAWMPFPKPYEEDTE